MNDRRFKILMVSTEAVPFIKEGGVADVMGSLPKELAALGHEVALFLPRYGSIDATRWSFQHTGLTKMVPVSGGNYFVSVWKTYLPDSPVIVYILDNYEFFGQ